MHKESEWYRKKALLYEIHDYDPADRTHNVHHVVAKSEGGNGDWENLALLPIPLHEWLHQLIQRIDDYAERTRRSS